jgi:23S rRNA (cytosine1962-C5)-methyltransferase
MKKIVIKQGKEEIIKRGHPWVFSGAILKADTGIKAGEVVELCQENGTCLATGFYNRRSDITFRLISKGSVVIDEGYWHQRITNALALRKIMIPADTNAYRLINSEGDYMPGLIVDRYGDTLVISISTAGLERQRASIIAGLTELVQPSAIYERDDGKSRRREGLEDQREWVLGTASRQVEILENGLKFFVDPVEGQKTGFFLDQRDNRQWAEKISKGLTVLNCFSYTGGFSVYAVRGGAQSVTSVDISAPACETAQKQLRMNGYSDKDHPVMTADVFDYLRSVEQMFDLIILDPPAFAKSADDVIKASRGYKDINMNAVKKLKPNGLLLTFSCSNHLE